MTTTKKNIRHSGADWLSSHVDTPLSPLGIRVANVLGQVYRGIYHIDSAVLSKKVLWDSPSVISVTVSGDLGTFDGDYLTALVLCCQRAKIAVNINGSCKGYTQLVFLPTAKFKEWDDEWGQFLGREVGQPIDLDRFLDSFATVKKTIQKYGPDNIVFSVESIRWPNLQALVVCAHEECIRVSIEGQSPNSLTARVSKRDRTGSMFKRHPSMEEHEAILEPCVGIDYSKF